MASVLETFMILFESDAADVQKGADSADRSTKRLNDSLKSTSNNADAVGGSFLRMMQSAAGAVGAALSVAAITSAVMETAAANDKLNDFTDRLGLNIEAVSAWGDAVTMNGGDALSFQSTLDGLTESLNMVAVKGTSRSAAFFKELGVDMLDANGKARDVMEVLPDIATAFEGLSKQESSGLGRKLGLDQGTIQLLQMGRREVDAQIKRQKELGVVTKQDAEIAGEFNDQQDRTAHVFRTLFTAVGSSVLPILTRLSAGIETVGTFFAKHSDFIVGLLIALGSAVLIYAVPPFLTLAASVITAFAPFLLMGLAIAAVAVAFALLYDDVMNFIDGNNSMIGQIVQKYPLLAEIAKALAGTFRFLWDVMAGLLQFIVQLFTAPSEAWENLETNIADGLLRLQQLFPSLFTTLGELGDVMATAGTVVMAVWGAIIGSVSEAIGTIMAAIDKVIGAYQKVRSFVVGGEDGGAARTQASIMSGKNALTTAAASPITSQTSSSITNTNRASSSNRTVSVGKVEVHTQATDAAGIAGAINTGLKSQLGQAAGQFDDGVAA